MTDSAEPKPTESKRIEAPRAAALKKFVLTFLILCVLWLILVYVIPYVAHVSGVPTNMRELSQGDPDSQEAVIQQKNQQIGELNSRIDQLDAKLKTFEEVITGMPKPSADSTPPDARIAAMQAKIDNLSLPSGNTEDNERVTQLEDKVGEQQKVLNDMKAQLSDAQSKGMHELAVITVFGQIKDAVARGEAFSDLLAQLKALTPDEKQAQEVMLQLAPVADTGMVALPVLQNAFEVTVPVALSPNAKAGTLMGNLHSLIRIRKIGEQLGNDDESVIARAEIRLNRGDVNGCVKELTQLSPPAATAFATWNNQAQAYVRLHETLDALQLALISPSTVPVTPPAPPPAAPVPTPVATPAPAAPAPEPAPAPVKPVVKSAPTPKPATEPEDTQDEAPTDADEPEDNAGK